MTQITGKSVRRATKPSHCRILFQRVVMCAIAIASGYVLLMKFSGPSLQSSSDPKPPLFAPTHSHATTIKKHHEEKDAKRKMNKKQHKGEVRQAKIEELQEDDIEKSDQRSYKAIREEFEQALGDPNDIERLHNFVLNLRKTKHELLDSLKSQVPYDVNDCPEEPPESYPIEWSIVDIIDNWNPNDTFLASNPDGEVRRGIYQSICRFNHSTEMDKILNYRKAEVPFLIRDDPDVLRVVERWNQPGYLSSILGKDTKHTVEYSETNSLMYFKTPKIKSKQRHGRRNNVRPQEVQSGSKNVVPEGWEPPMQNIEMTYTEWEEVASQDEHDMGPDMPHWYFRVNAKKYPNSRSRSSNPGNVIFDELPFFQPKENLYMVEPSDARGINCRFGMMGNTAAGHFDGSRNFVMLFGGERRYILSHPKNCRNLALYPLKHPSGRHTAVDWSDPDLIEYPEFAKARGNEVVLQAGDVLYLPTQWFHHIISLDLNWQCNARSGTTDHYQDDISQCGFVRR